MCVHVSAVGHHGVRSTLLPWFLSFHLRRRLTDKETPGGWATEVTRDKTHLLSPSGPTVGTETPGVIGITFRLLPSAPFDPTRVEPRSPGRRLRVSSLTGRVPIPDKGPRPLRRLGWDSVPTLTHVALRGRDLECLASGPSPSGGASTTAPLRDTPVSSVLPDRYRVLCGGRTEAWTGPCGGRHIRDPDGSPSPTHPGPTRPVSRPDSSHETRDARSTGGSLVGVPESRHGDGSRRSRSGRRRSDQWTEEDGLSLVQENQGRTRSRRGFVVPLVVLLECGGLGSFLDGTSRCTPLRPCFW